MKCFWLWLVKPPRQRRAERRASVFHVSPVVLLSLYLVLDWPGEADTAGGADSWNSVLILMPRYLRVRSIVWLVQKLNATLGFALTFMISSLIRTLLSHWQQVSVKKWMYSAAPRGSVSRGISPGAFWAGTWFILSYKKNCIPLLMYMWPIKVMGLSVFFFFFFFQLLNTVHWIRKWINVGMTLAELSGV